MEGIPGTVISTAAASTALSSPTLEAMRSTSWLPTNVLGKISVGCRSSAWASSQKFASASEDQVAFHSSYWVTASREPALPIDE